MRIGLTRKLPLALVAGGALLAASAGPALAGVVTTTAGITGGGGVTIATPGAVNLSATLSGADQVVAGTLGASRVKDASGLGQGWQVQVSGTLFTTGGAAPRTLAADALSVVGVGAGKVAGKMPTNSVSYGGGITVPLGASVTPVKIYNAAGDSGMGTFDLTPNVALSVPADAYAGSYASDITISVVAGP
jgi:hypothetical protein